MKIKGSKWPAIRLFASKLFLIASKKHQLCISCLSWFEYICNRGRTSQHQLSIIMMASSNGSIFPVNWPFVRGIHRPLANSPHNGRWHGALMFSLIYAWTNGWVNNRDSGDLRRHRAHCDSYHDVMDGTISSLEMYFKSTFFAHIARHVI